MENKEKMNNAIRNTLNYCMNELNFVDDKWNDNNFPAYDDVKNDDNTNED